MMMISPLMMCKNFNTLIDLNIIIIALSQFYASRCFSNFVQSGIIQTTVISALFCWANTVAVFLSIFNVECFITKVETIRMVSLNI